MELNHKNAHLKFKGFFLTLPDNRHSYVNSSVLIQDLGRIWCFGNSDGPDSSFWLPDQSVHARKWCRVSGPHENQAPRDDVFTNGGPKVTWAPTQFCSRMSERTCKFARVSRCSASNSHRLFLDVFGEVTRVSHVLCIWVTRIPRGSRTSSFSQPSLSTSASFAEGQSRSLVAPPAIRCMVRFAAWEWPEDIGGKMTFRRNIISTIWRWIASWGPKLVVSVMFYLSLTVSS